MDIVQSMSSFLPGLYLAAIIFQIYWLVRAIVKSDRRLWARTFKFSAFMCLFSYVLFYLTGLSQNPSTDADLAALGNMGAFIYSFVGGIVFLVLWLVSLGVGLIKFKKKREEQDKRG